MYNMEKIPTADDFLNKEYYHIILDSRDTWINVGDIKRAMIEFAKLHVEVALIAVGNEIIGPAAGSVRDIYPLENIK